MVCPALCAGSKWNIPVVIISSGTQMFFHQNPPWAWPAIAQGKESDNLNTYQRFLAVVHNIFDGMVFKYILLHPYKTVLQDTCPTLSLHDFYSAPGGLIPHIVPTAIGFEFPRIISPLTHYIGPLLHRRETPFPTDLKKWMEKRTDRSVVYISMGSKFKLSKEHCFKLLKGVMEANLGLVWSLRKSNQWALSDFLLDPNKVFVLEWSPQLDILTSHKIHSAILHGGFNGLSEALANAVPVLGIPCTDEQHLNVGRLSHSGLGLLLELDGASASDVTTSLIKLGSYQFRHNLRNLNKAFKLAGGPARAVDLVELYAEIGYSHLVPAYSKYRWNWIQYYNVDVWLLFVSLLLLVALLAVKIASFSWCRCCRDSRKVKVE